MKVKLSLLAGVVSLAAVTGAFAQTAVTDPVGYITLNVSGGGSTAAPVLSYIGATLVNKTEFSGPYTASGQSSLTFADGSFTAGQFDAAAGVPQYYVEITSGANAGVWTDIVSNTANALTLADDISGLAGASGSAVIRKHHTIASLFGAENSAGFLGGADVASADELQVIDAATQSQTTIFYSTDDLNSGWVTSAGQPAGNFIVPPGVGIKVSRKAADPLPIIQVGHVKTGQTWLPIEQGINVLNVPLATGVTLGNSQLSESGLTGGADIAGADEVGTIDAGVFTSYFFSTDDLNSGWVTAAGAGAADKLLAEGTGFRVIRKSPAFNWKAPAQQIAN